MDRAEATGLGVATAIHVALFAALTLGLATSRSLPSAGDPIEVSFADDVGMTSLAPDQVPVPPPPGAAPDAGLPEDAPALPAPRPAEPAPSPVPAETPARRQAEAPRASPPVPNRAPAARPAPNSPARAARTRRPLTADELLAGLGRDPSPATTPRPAAAMTGEARASINAAIRRALVPCERQPLPAPEAGAIKVDVRVSLDRDGSLAAAQVSRVRNDNPALQIYEQRMQDLALAIVRRCTPIRGLPSELYDVPRGWRQFTYQFDPRQTR